MYSHSALLAAIVAPSMNQILPLQMEFIHPQDGTDKQDCEHQAARRWLAEVSPHYRELDVTIVGDALFAVQPIIRQVLEGQMDYLFTAKEEAHRYLYEEIASLEKLGEVQSLERKQWDGKAHKIWRYRWANGVRLRNEDDSVNVNWVEAILADEDGKQRFRIAFITSHLVTDKNVEEVVRAGRTRWKIENEDINTLKTKGYHIEHNFGHGKQYLAQTLLSLNIVAFLFHTVPSSPGDWRGLELTSRRCGTYSIVMQRLTRRFVLLVSLACVVLGLFLLGANVGVVPAWIAEVVLDLWPLVLVAGGGILLADSIAKRRLARSSVPATHRHELALGGEAREVSCRIQFSYGRLKIDTADEAPSLRCEHVGPAPEPLIEQSVRGGRAELSLSMQQPLFPSAFQLSNTWHLSLPPALPLTLDLHVHEAILQLDLRALMVDRLDLRADSGAQEILLGDRQRHLAARITSSSADLVLVVPAAARVDVALLNPFCRIEYPQGDFERRGDGSLVSSRADPNAGRIELTLDGALRSIMLDIEDPAAG